MKILIGADFVPTKSNMEMFQGGQTQELLGEGLKNILESSDFRIFNLEMPLTDISIPIDKNGPNLYAPTLAVNGYKAVKVDLFTLANNHILDQGGQGLESTINVLKQNHIEYLGVGKDLSEASQPYYFECGGKKIGVYACAEHEFSIVSNSSAGANPFDAIESIKHINAMRANCDFIIVLYHGGKEHYRYPSPELQKVCRAIIDSGAGLVICQHTHCIGCEEKYGEGTIVYGQGNFLFDSNNSEYWQTSLLVEISDGFNISYIPLIKSGNGVRVADSSRAKDILQAFYNRSAEILTDGFVEQKYEQFAQSMIYYYLGSVGGYNKFLFRCMNKLTGKKFGQWYLKHKFNKGRLLSIKNYVECEAHRELLLKGIDLII